MNINKHPLLKQAYELSLAIENLPASDEATHLTMLASELGHAIDEHLAKEGAYLAILDGPAEPIGLSMESTSNVPTSTMPRKYRKLPLVVEAVQFNPDPKSFERIRGQEMTQFMFLEYPVLIDLEGPYLSIKTPSGAVRVVPGDWIITGTSGEKYPCKDEIFRKTYEAVALSNKSTSLNSAAHQQNQINSLIHAAQFCDAMKLKHPESWTEFDELCRIGVHDVLAQLYENKSCQKIPYRNSDDCDIAHPITKSEGPK